MGLMTLLFRGPMQLPLLIAVHLLLPLSAAAAISSTAAEVYED